MGPCNAAPERQMIHAFGSDKTRGRQRSGLPADAIRRALPGDGIVYQGAMSGGRAEMKSATARAMASPCV